MAKTFDDVQLFFEFLTVLNDATKRVDASGNTVDLLSNLDPSGNTNTAVELAKIYSWYQQMVDYDSSTNTFVIKASSLPDDVKNVQEGYYDSSTKKFYTDSTKATQIPGREGTIFVDTASNEIYRYDATSATFKLVSGTDTTYSFQEGTTDGSFQVKEDNDSWQTIKVHNVATLGSDGKVPSSQLPSYVDDVIEGYLYNGKFYAESAHTTEIVGEAGKIYTDLTTNKTYRWGGSAFVEISASLALGETSSTAYRGDRGKIAYDHSQLTSGNPHNVTKSDVGLGNVDNTADANKSVKSAATLTTARTIDGVSFNGSSAIIHYGESSTEAAATTKVVACTGFTLVKGAWIAVKFTVTNTGAVASLQLNVNSTGGKAIKYRNANLPSAGTLAANRVYLFVYDGTNYQLVGDLDTNTQDGDTKMRQTLITTTDSKLRPLLMSYAETSTSTTNVDNIGYRMATVYVDTSDGSIHVPKIVTGEIVDTSGNTPVMSNDILILHCNNKPELLS
jgi:hypothetical protein